MTPDEKTRIRILAAIGIATSIGGAWLGYTLASKHKLGGAVVGLLLSPAIGMPLGLLVAPNSLEPIGRKPAA